LVHKRFWHFMVTLRNLAGSGQIILQFGLTVTLWFRSSI